MLKDFEYILERLDYDVICVATKTVDATKSEKVLRLYARNDYGEFGPGLEDYVYEFTVLDGATTVEEFFVNVPVDETGDITEIMSEFEEFLKK